jgi:hypothetical protein
MLVEDCRVVQNRDEDGKSLQSWQFILGLRDETGLISSTVVSQLYDSWFEALWSMNVKIDNKRKDDNYVRV